MCKEGELKVADFEYLKTIILKVGGAGVSLTQPLVSGSK